MPTITVERDAEHAHRLLDIDPLFAKLRDEFGYPPCFKRPGGFVTLLKIILEQQVSLASAAAVFQKLRHATGEVTPENLLDCSDDQLHNFGFSRQKLQYARGLAEALLTQRLRLSTLPVLTNGEAKRYLMQIKGIGEWTADVYLLMAEERPDVFPAGDLALQLSWQQCNDLPAKPTAEELAVTARRWRPFRSTAAKWLWHAYLERSAIPFE